jgi:adenylylsulfate kinase
MKPNTIRILIMGLPGSGKTTMARALKQHLESSSTVEWFNADDVRKRFNDWDFDLKGRVRQSLRMRDLADQSLANFVIADFVSALEEQRTNFQAHWTIWMDTLTVSRFEDTNQIFVSPNNYDFRVTEQNAEEWAKFIGDQILKNQRRSMIVCCAGMNQT